MKQLKFFSLLLFQILLLINWLQAISQVARPVEVAYDLEQQIDNIFSEYNDLNKPGAVVGVVKDGRLVFTKGYGSANLEYDIPNTPSTIFDIASVAKQFTVFSILLLADQGKLTLDDDIRTYVSEVPDFGKTITLRHLLSHTSGLRDLDGMLALAGWLPGDIVTKKYALKLISDQKELNFEPGEAYLYCNTGFILLTEVVSRVSGQSFAKFTSSNIFEPLQMHNTFIYSDHEKIVRHRAYSYHVDSVEYKKSVLNEEGKLFTTVEDLSRWVLNFSLLKVGNAEIINQMNTLARLNSGKTFGVAYGQFVGNYRGLNLLHHDGGVAGYRAYLGRFPDQDFAVIVLSNSATTNAPRLGIQVADLFLAKHFQTSSIDKELWEDNHPATNKNITYSSDELKGFAKTFYSEEINVFYTFYIADDKLMLQHPRVANVSLEPIEQDIFYNDLRWLTVKFVRDNNNKIKGCRISNDRVKNLWFRKTE